LRWRPNCGVAVPTPFWPRWRIAPFEPALSALAGRTIVVTRPREQAGPLCDAIVAAGGQAVPFPLLEIIELRDDPACAVALLRLNDAALAVFISPNAVAYGFARAAAQGPWPPKTAVAAVGQGTARALRELGFRAVIVPSSGFDSEALLACPELSAGAVAGKVVVLFKGEGGRDLLAGSLTERGATVWPAPCYRRLPPANGLTPLIALYAAGNLHGMVLSSSEAVRHLGALLPRENRRLLDETPVFCPHVRIAEAAAAIACKKICLTPPGDAGILAGLSEYNWPSN
jgi:uroporphyrinogen-III synthase